MTATVSSVALVDEARAGSAVALERLLESVWPDAYRIAYSIIGDRAAAEDAAQEACAIVHRKISTLRNASAFRVWFYRIVVREARGLRVMTPSSGDLRAVRTGITSDASLDVRHALESLPNDLRAVVILHYYADLTSKEIAAVLNVTAPTVRFRLMLARRRLKPLLEEQTSPTRAFRSEDLQ